MAYKSNREIEQELLERIYEEGYSAETLVEHIMCYFDSDTTVDVLKDFCNDYDVDVTDITEDEDEDED